MVELVSEVTDILYLMHGHGISSREDRMRFSGSGDLESLIWKSPHDRSSSRD
jgi:hypothetical protein